MRYVVVATDPTEVAPSETEWARTHASKLAAADEARELAIETGHPHYVCSLTAVAVYSPPRKIS